MIFELLASCYAFFMNVWYQHRRTSENDNLRQFLTESYSTRTLKQYVQSYTHDKHLISSLRTKKQLVNFVLSNTSYVPNSIMCDVCYDTDPSSRVHRCSKCVFNTCISCINRLPYPTLCPQCREPLFLHNITNYIDWFKTSCVCRFSIGWICVTCGCLCISCLYHYNKWFFFLYTSNRQC